MKRLSIFAAMALAAVMNFSCSEQDNPVAAVETMNYKIGETPIAGELIATLQGEVGAEVTLTLGVYAPNDVYAVDFGDGKLQIDSVGWHNGGVREGDGEVPSEIPGTTHTSATKFAGTVAGEGIVKVYGRSNLWYLNISGNLMPTSFDQKKLLNVVQVSITGANVESVSLPALSELTQFAFNNSPVKTVDVSKATSLTSLTINSTTASKYEPQLESIDLSKNVNLESISLQGNNKNSGKLTKLDLTHNTKLTGMGLYVQYNQLSELKLGENTLTAVNVQNNQLTSIDTEKLPLLKSLYAADNQLTSIDVSNMANLTWLDVKNNQLTGDLDLTANQKFANVYVNNNQLTSVTVTDVTKQFYFDNNRMTIATMPAKPASMNTASKTKQYHYAPQADMEVAAQDGIVDLSAQAKAKGLLEEEVATTFKLTSGDTELVEGTDYNVLEAGKFEFLKDVADVIVTMTTAAFPDLTLLTKAFSVKAAAPVAEARTWDFTKWSEATIANLKAEAAKVTIEDDPDNEGCTKCTNNDAAWSDHEKATKNNNYDVTKDNCFWCVASANEDGALSANGVVIEELKGLKFNSDYTAARSLAIAVNYPKALSDYAGAAYLWLGGKGKDCFTIPAVKAGQKITVVVESHKASDARGITINEESFTPTTQDTHTWTIAEDGDVVVKNTNGCHIYSITVE